MVEHLPSKSEALSSSASAGKKEKIDKNTFVLGVFPETRPWCSFNRKFSWQLL
jgi:hypothetical protein